MAEAPAGRGLVHWIRRGLPTRESIERNRWLRPVAHRVMAPHLWRFTRRSVPRGVALGVVTGILIPMGQIPASALFALPLRANIPAAALTTLLTNPITTPPLWMVAYWLGKWELGLGSAVSDAVAEPGWGHWLLAEAGPAMLAGLTTITAALTLLGFAATKLGWRWWIGRKWRRRARARG